MRRMICMTILTALMSSCATNKKQDTIPTQSKVMSPATMSELALGKSMFQDGYYKRALKQLLPLAAEGNMEAQYAVGYMYYYGLGTTQDTDSGYFWIKRSADQKFQPAMNALVIVDKEQRKKGR